MRVRESELASYLEYSTKSLSSLVWRDIALNTKQLRREPLKVAGRKHKPSGYWQVAVNGISYQAHRVVWAILNGDIPQGYFINHKDCDRGNNNIENLELRTRKENASLNKTSVHGITRVGKNKNTALIGEHFSSCGKYKMARVQFRDSYNRKKTKAFSYIKHGENIAWGLAKDYLESQIKWSDILVALPYQEAVIINCCRNNLLWYHHKIGEAYLVEKVEPTEKGPVVWVRTRDEFNTLNFIYLEDTLTWKNLTKH